MERASNIHPPDALLDAVRAAERVWLGTHVDPDGDAIGSTLGLAGVLEALGLDVTVACRDEPPADLMFLPGVKRFETRGPGPEHDLAIALDAAEARRLGDLHAPDTWKRPMTAVIDHHASNPGFGRINWIDPAAASTAEMVVRLAEALGVRPDAAAATCLLTGIITDTLGFRTSATTAFTLRAASGLVDCGADLAMIMHRVFNSRPLSGLRLIGRAIDDLRVVDGFGIATLTSSDFADLGATPQQARGISSFLAATAELTAVALLRERDDRRVDVSMRARPGPGVDLVPAATALGGGGHPLACGATIDGPLDAAADIVVAVLVEHVGSARRPADTR